MKNHQQNSESILERAEKMFRRKNYLVAKREFEKLYRMIQKDDIMDKIRICDEEIKQDKAKELIKKGRRHLSKENWEKAFNCFEEAYKISNDEWLKEKIDALKIKLNKDNTLNAAEEAMADQNYEKAANFYAELVKDSKKENFIIKQACCLILAEKYDEAVNVFDELPFIELPDEMYFKKESTADKLLNNNNNKQLKSEKEGWLSKYQHDKSLMYDYGFVLAKTGLYYECMRVWDTLESCDTVFQEQKAVVIDLLISC